MTSTTLPAPDSDTPFQPRRLARNWPMLIGLLLISAVTTLGIRGPSMAPRDPLEENLIIHDVEQDKWFIPPFTAFEVDGFPLGSDEFGRDLYSRLLHAIRPTLEMVLVVASVRLVLGTLIGLFAGWSTGRAGRLFDSLISGALALPGLLVALGAIAIVGVELGVKAFVIGLSITGWAETARIVREQTRTIRGEVYVEAAQALGSTDPEIVFRHVLRQIRSMLVMLLAFEVGSTLMLTAGLGFLGYYIGGDVWVDVADFVARRTSGTPELGQMLATAWVRLTDPWGLVSVGTVVFVSVLGFNLIGEGFRLRLSPDIQLGRNRWLTAASAKLRLNVEQAWHPVGQLLFGSRLAVILWMFALGIGVGCVGVNGWQAGWFRLSEAEVNLLFEDDAVEIAGQSPTPATVDASGNGASGGPDSQTVSAAPGEAGSLPPAVAWSFPAGAQITGKPALSPDGIIYIASANSLLTALNPDGSVLWQLELAAKPVGPPALGADGTIYVTDKNGTLSAFLPDGALAWQFVREEPRAASSGPVVASDNRIYYALNGQAGAVQAVGADGTGLWVGAGDTTAVFDTPIVSADPALVFLHDDAFDAATGALLPLDFPAEIHRFLVGGDGRLYARAAHTVMEWQYTEAGTAEVLESFTWAYQSFIGEQYYPHEAGVTVNGVSWELYTTELGGATQMFYVDVVDGEGQLRASSGADDLSLGTLVALDDETLETVICGFGDYLYPNLDSPRPECQAFMPGGAKLLWHFKLDKSRILIGAAYDGRMLYLTTEEGDLFAVDTAPEPEAASPVMTTGSGWIFNAPAGMSITPLVHPDGRVYLVTEANEVYTLSPAGSVENIITLSEVLYPDGSQVFGGDIRFIDLPVLNADGSLVFVQAGRLVALEPDGRLRWEIPLDGELAGPPVSGPDEETDYLLDGEGSLYAFNAVDGLLWKHTLEANFRPAFPFPVFGQKGEIYYTITSGYSGSVEAVDGQGNQLWRTRLSTSSFYNMLQISPDGAWIVVDDNLVDAATGALVEPQEMEFNIDSFSMGYDGKTYLMSGTTAMQWEVLPDGQLNILSQVSFNPPANVGRSLPNLEVTADGIIWMQFFPPGGRMINLWVNPVDGTSLGLVEVVFSEEMILDMDIAGGTLTICAPDAELNQIECRGYAVGSSEPVWDIVIAGIGEADGLFYLNGVLYIQVDEDTLQTVIVEIP